MFEALVRMPLEDLRWLAAYLVQVSNSYARVPGWEALDRYLLQLAALVQVVKYRREMPALFLRADDRTRVREMAWFQAHIADDPGSEALREFWEAVLAEVTSADDVVTEFE